MRSDSQGSYASHIARGHGHNGRAICHDFRPDDTRRPTGALYWVLGVLFIAAIIGGYVMARGGAVDRTHYAVESVR